MSTHHTEPGGDPVAFDLGGGVRCTKVAVGPMDNNVWFLWPDGGPAVLVDAAAEAPRLLSSLDGHQLAAVVTTHRHHDHIGAVAEVVAATDAAHYCGRPDAAAIAEATDTTPTGLWDGDLVAVGHQGFLEVIGLVGHTPGAIALAWTPVGGPAHLFTGDALFPGGVGGTRSARDFSSLLSDVTTKVFERFGDDTQVHPGHGDDTTLGAERPHLDEWRARGW